MLKTTFLVSQISCDYAFFWTCC